MPFRTIFGLNIENWAAKHQLDKLLVETEGDLVSIVAEIASFLVSDLFIGILVGGLVVSFWGAVHRGVVLLAKRVKGPKEEDDETAEMVEIGHKCLRLSRSIEETLDLCGSNSREAAYRAYELVSLLRTLEKQGFIFPLKEDHEIESSVIYARGYLYSLGTFLIDGHIGEARRMANSLAPKFGDVSKDELLSYRRPQDTESETQP